MNKKFLSVLLAIVMVFTMIPMKAIATEDEYVYISISEEGQFITDASGKAMAYTAVPMDALKAIDLNDYGLSDYIYDMDGDGNYEITALHLFIYTHETILGMDWSNVDPYGGSPASMYFTSGLFGFADENLRYNYNGKYPADENGWGFTADRIVLSAGDYMEVAHFDNFFFYMDTAYGFRYFTNDNDEITIDFDVEVGENLPVKLIRVAGGLGFGEIIENDEDVTVYYGKSINNAVGSVTTSDDGYVDISFPSAGTWYIWCDGGVGVDMADGDVVTSPASAKVTVVAKQEQPGFETPRESQDVSRVLNTTLAQLATTVTEPQFGTTAGEWTVLCLARSDYYAKNDAYFTNYYDRIVEYVNAKATSINMNGALHKKKSTDNSRLIVALSAIGKDATCVGDWNLIAPYDDFNWIKNQGINGTIWALIALDSNNYQTTDPNIRQQCINQILDMELETGGWPLASGKFDNDITAMALQALYPYRNQPEVAAAAERAFNYLSEIQLNTGGFLYGSAETSESAAQVIVACTTWGINPDTDSRFIKNGKSVVDNLLSYYVEADAMFAHQGNSSNAMATDQACYALVAYNRFINGKNSLYNYSDVVFDNKDTVVLGNPKVTLGLPSEITDDMGNTFNATISLDQWDNTAGYKLIDFIVNVPEGLTVTDVVAGNRLGGGTVKFYQEEDNGKLRIVYFDANNHGDITVKGNSYPALMFTVTFCADSINEGDKLNISIGGMSIKRTSDSTDENSMVVVDTTNAIGKVSVVKGVSYSAVCLYTGDDVDLIPSSKKAVAVSVVGLEDVSKLTYNDGTNVYDFMYSREISDKTGVVTYVAIVDEAVNVTQFTNKENFVFTKDAVDEIVFGDTNGDGVVNAQDALAAVDTWLRKSDEPTDEQILALNVNSDSRINTFDALGIVEAFVDNSEYRIVTKAATVITKK